MILQLCATVHFEAMLVTMCAAHVAALVVSWRERNRFAVNLVTRLVWKQTSNKQPKSSQAFCISGHAHFVLICSDVCFWKVLWFHWDEGMERTGLIMDAASPLGEAPPFWSNRMPGSLSMCISSKNLFRAPSTADMEHVDVVLATAHLICMKPSGKTIPELWLQLYCDCAYCAALRRLGLFCPILCGGWAEEAVQRKVGLQWSTSIGNPRKPSQIASRVW